MTVSSSSPHHTGSNSSIPRGGRILVGSSGVRSSSYSVANVRLSHNIELFDTGEASGDCAGDGSSFSLSPLDSGSLKIKDPSGLFSQRSPSGATPSHFGLLEVLPDLVVFCGIVSSSLEELDDAFSISGCSSMGWRTMF